jgi:site-specific DNA recombinase
VSIVPAKIRCAIYTRKSSEEGLEQSFNSLHAQREACEAYVLSQQHEGWQLHPPHYDDGGFSGGNIERPGLKQLLNDIAAKKIDTVVVYKVDRLTRSLADFAKIVEQFDQQGISFVSVTQQFNTTTSMGRLTLNVLLSFAQFEREVTGERIRDKVAASKKKGMWMGGKVPLGYDLSEGSLIINEVEAEQVREIYKQYLRLGSVFDLHEYLIRSNSRSKVRVNSAGRSSGGAIFSRGTLYNLLNSPLYIGQISHKGVTYPGRHKPIVGEAMWHEVADRLKANSVKRNKVSNLPSSRLLLGILFDSDGNRFTPSHASKAGRRYSYYTSHGVIAKRKSKVIQRIPATEIEQIVGSRVRALLSSGFELSIWFSTLTIKELRVLIAGGQGRAEKLANITSLESAEFLRSILIKVVVRENELGIELNRKALQVALLGLNSKREAVEEDAECIDLICPFTIKRRGREVRIVVSAGEISKPQGVPSLMKAVARSRDWADLIVAGKARTIDDLVKISGLNKRYVRRIMHCAALSPQLLESILHGRQPVDLTVMRLTQNLPLDWYEQHLD